MFREHALNAKDFTNKRYRHRAIVDEEECGSDRSKSVVHAKVSAASG